MFREKLGNKILYLLSEKKSLPYNKLRQYVEDFKSEEGILRLEKNDLKQRKDSYCYSSLVRSLSSLGYLDIGKKGNKPIVKIAPPMLVALPYIKPTFLLTGARTSSFLQLFKNGKSFEIKLIKNDYLPDTVLIEPESLNTLETWCKETQFQGNKLSDYIRLHKKPIAWNMLKCSGKLTAYEKQLELDWFSGDESHIRKIFDVNKLKFIPFNLQKTEKKHLSLVKIYHFESYCDYYLFDFSKKEKVFVDLDWGKFLVIQRSNNSILEYNIEIFELTSYLRLPLVIERGLSLLSGNLVEVGRNKEFTFKNVPCQIAELVADKLGQKLVKKRM